MKKSSLILLVLLLSARFIYCQNTVYSEIIGEDRISFGFDNSTLYLDNGKLLSPHFISKELDGNTLVPSTLTYIGNQIDIKSLYDAETENDRKKVREVMTMYHLNKVRTFSESVLAHLLQDVQITVVANSPNINPTLQINTVDDEPMIEFSIPATSGGHNPLAPDETVILAHHGRFIGDYLEYTDLATVNTAGKWAEYRNFSTSLGEIYKVRNPSQIYALQDGYLSQYGLTSLNDLTKLEGLPKIKELILKNRIGSNFPQISTRLKQLINANKFDDFAAVISNPSNSDLFTFFHAASGDVLGRRYSALEIVSEYGQSLDELELGNIAGFIKNTGKSVTQILDDIPTAGGYNLWYGRVVLEKSTRISLSSIENAQGVKIFTDSDIDDILLRAWYLDDKLILTDGLMAQNRVAKIVDEFGKPIGGTYTNPEGLKDFSANNGWIKPSIVDGNGNIPNGGIKSLKDFLNELEPGISLKQNGNTISISKKHIDGSGIENEIDILIHNLFTIIECKRVSGASYSAVRSNIQKIIDKFTEPLKISENLKTINYNHYGYLNIDEVSNPFRNLNKDEFITAAKDGLNGNPGFVGDLPGQIKVSDIKKVEQIEVVNGSSESPFIINKSEWD